jgi:hypothetical protein
MGLSLRVEGTDATMHFSYSGFDSFRREICDRVGGINWDEFDKNDVPDEWEGLAPLLDHSDCDGNLKWWECAGVEDALRRLAGGEDGGDSYRDTIVLLADFLGWASRLKKRVLFL